MPVSQRWTFITNHGLVLSYLSHNPRSTAREIANYVGVTERTTHKIISDLEAAGYIERRKDGRRNVYRVDPKLPLRHHTTQDILVEELLEALTVKKPTTPPATTRRRVNNTDASRASQPSSRRKRPPRASSSS